MHVYLPFLVKIKDLLYLAITNFYATIVHNTGIKLCSSIVYQYCDLKKKLFTCV